MSYVEKLVLADSFDARGVLVKKGHVGVFDTERLNGDEKHLEDVGDFQPAVVEIAALGPTGPNPKMPQQIPPEAYQGPGGNYQMPGKVLVGEVTNPVEDRIEAAGLRDGTEEKVDARLADIMGSGDPDVQLREEAKANGTVAEVTSDLGTKTDAQLDELIAAEKAGKNRVTVIAAVEAEQAARKEATPV